MMTPFKYGRPSRDWYKSFINRNCHIIQGRADTSFETCRAKLTKYKVNKWYSIYRDFVVKIGVLEKPIMIFKGEEQGEKAKGSPKQSLIMLKN